MGGEQLNFLADGARKATPKKRRDRRERDAYFSPMHAVYALRQVLGDALTGDELVDPCCGDGRMAEVFASQFCYLTLNDIAPRIEPDRLQRMRGLAQVVVKSCDATLPSPGLWVGTDWVVTNPPWNLASTIAQFALAEARRGVALLLRLSFLEATRARQWLKRNPPKSLIVLPRISFDGSGKSDSVCPAWFLWGPAVKPGVHIFGKADAAQLALMSAQ